MRLLTGVGDVRGMGRIIKAFDYVRCCQINRRLDLPTWRQRRRLAPQARNHDQPFLLLPESLHITTCNQLCDKRAEGGVDVILRQRLVRQAYASAMQHSKPVGGLVSATHNATQQRTRCGMRERLKAEGRGSRAGPQREIRLQCGVQRLSLEGVVMG